MSSPPSSTPGAVEIHPVAHTGEIDTAVAAARRVVAALLQVGETSPAELGEVAGRLGAIADHLEGHAPAAADRLAEMWAGGRTGRYNPATGAENALAPPLSLEGTDDGSVEGVVTLGLLYQGPPGYVHGGVSALLLDHALGVANHWAGTSGVTAELALRYHRPTPLLRELTVTGRQESVDGRKIRSVGTLSAGGEVCVSAEGLFVASARR